MLGRSSNLCGFVRCDGPIDLRAVLKRLLKKRKTLDNGRAFYVELRFQPIDMFKLGQKLGDAPAHGPALSSDRQAAIARTSRAEKPVAMKSRIRPARRRSASL